MTRLGATDPGIGNKSYMKFARAFTDATPNDIAKACSASGVSFKLSNPECAVVVLLTIITVGIYWLVIFVLAFFNKNNPRVPFGAVMCSLTNGKVAAKVPAPPGGAAAEKLELGGADAGSTGSAITPPTGDGAPVSGSVSGDGSIAQPNPSVSGSGDGMQLSDGGESGSDGSVIDSSSPIIVPPVKVAAAPVSVPKPPPVPRAVNVQAPVFSHTPAVSVISQPVVVQASSGDPALDAAFAALLDRAPSLIAGIENGTITTGDEIEAVLRLLSSRAAHWHELFMAEHTDLIRKIIVAARKNFKYLDVLVALSPIFDKFQKLTELPISAYEKHCHMFISTLADTCDALGGVLSRNPDHETYVAAAVILLNSGKTDRRYLEMSKNNAALRKFFIGTFGGRPSIIDRLEAIHREGKLSSYKLIADLKGLRDLCFSVNPVEPGALPPASERTFDGFLAMLDDGNVEGAVEYLDGVGVEKVKEYAERRTYEENFALYNRILEYANEKGKTCAEIVGEVKHKNAKGAIIALFNAFFSSDEYIDFVLSLPPQEAVKALAAKVETFFAIQKSRSVFSAICLATDEQGRARMLEWLKSLDPTIAAKLIVETMKIPDSGVIDFLTNPRTNSQADTKAVNDILASILVNGGMKVIDIFHPAEQSGRNRFRIFIETDAGQDWAREHLAKDVEFLAAMANSSVWMGIRRDDKGCLTYEVEPWVEVVKLILNDRLSLAALLSGAAGCYHLFYLAENNSEIAHTINGILEVDAFADILRTQHGHKIIEALGDIARGREALEKQILGIEKFCNGDCEPELLAGLMKFAHKKRVEISEKDYESIAICVLKECDTLTALEMFENDKGLKALIDEINKDCDKAKGKFAISFFAAMISGCVWFCQSVFDDIHTDDFIKFFAGLNFIAKTKLLSVVGNALYNFPSSNYRWRLDFNESVLQQLAGNNELFGKIIQALKKHGGSYDAKIGELFREPHVNGLNVAENAIINFFPNNCSAAVTAMKSAGLPLSASPKMILVYMKGQSECEVLGRFCSASADGFIVTDSEAKADKQYLEFDAEYNMARTQLKESVSSPDDKTRLEAERVNARKKMDGRKAELTKEKFYKFVGECVTEFAEGGRDAIAKAANKLCRRQILLALAAMAKDGNKDAEGLFIGVVKHIIHGYGDTIQSAPDV
ncbi:MAG: hypothetical protein LBB38_02340 [Puniceicoccales bacterium]|nr:hypothetical protein [Puniceicoccales bacterium]